MQEELNSLPGETADAARAQLVEECTRWVSEGLSLIDEHAPEEAQDPLPTVDLFTLYGELKGMREDIKRDLKRNAGFLEDFRRTMEELRPPLDTDKGREPARPTTTTPEPGLDALFDLYNRSARLIPLWEDTLKSKSLMLRLCGVKALLEDILESQQIFRRKCEARFRELSIDVTGKAGAPFDPLTMKAVDVKQGKGKPEGTVLEVVRHGFIREGIIISYAEVIVMKNKE